jgi:hypothetical protein
VVHRSLLLHSLGQAVLLTTIAWFAWHVMLGQQVL